MINIPILSGIWIYLKWRLENTWNTTLILLTKIHRVLHFLSGRRKLIFFSVICIFIYSFFTLHLIIIAYSFSPFLLKNKLRAKILYLPYALDYVVWKSNPLKRKVAQRYIFNFEVNFSLSLYLGSQFITALKMWKLKNVGHC